MASIIPLKPENYALCSNIWDMEKNRELAERCYRQLAEGNRIIFVYVGEPGGEYLGEGALVLDAGDPQYSVPGKRIYLSRLVVKKEYRHQGIGSALMDFLIAHARELGYEEMSVGVDTDNLPARRLYEQKGFTHVLFQGTDEQGEYLKLLKVL